MSRTRTLVPLALVGAVALVAALALVLSRTGADPAAAATTTKATATADRGAFRTALAAKLAGRLGKPLDDVTAALKTAAQEHRPAKPEGATRKERRAARRDGLADRLEARAKALRDGKRGKAGKGAAAAKAHERFDAWAADVAKALDLDAADVKTAVRGMVDERLQGLMSDGWLTAAQHDARLACFDDAAKCTPATRGSTGLALLRAGVA